MVFLPSPVVVVVNITFPAQPVMNSTRLRAELHKKNNLQDITFNFNWTLLDDAATYQNCAIGYYQNTVLWLIGNDIFYPVFFPF